MPISASVTAQISIGQPVGSIVAFYGNASQLSPGWLMCDGSSFDLNKYPALFTLLGDKATTPDLRGYFVRGLDPSGKIDPAGQTRKIGDPQNHDLMSHAHDYSTWAFGSGPGYSGGGNDFNPNTPRQTGSTGGKETRPVNVALNYIIFAGFPPGQP